ncbi:MAG: MarR family transcriptional regulator [Ignavibacteria bacterium]|nr:MarR family transcriptional regulator [Ignavibacteria bacterium]
MLINSEVEEKVEDSQLREISFRNVNEWNLDISLGFLLNRTARGMKRLLDAKLVDYNITATQYIVLMRMVEEDGISLTELGERLHLDNPTLTGIIDRMERDRFLRRQRDTIDRRVVNVYLTENGKMLCKEIEHLAKETDEEIWSDFSINEKRAMLNYLERIWNNVNDKLN